MMKPLREISRRWDASPPTGKPILLPNGEMWVFYEPKAKLRATVSHGTVKAVPSWTFGEDIDPETDAVLAGRFAQILLKLRMAFDDEDRASVILEASWFLLARNYDVTSDEFATLIRPAGAWDADRQAALGQAFALLVSEACARANGHLEIMPRHG